MIYELLSYYSGHQNSQINLYRITVAKAIKLNAVLAMCQPRDSKTSLQSTFENRIKESHRSIKNYLLQFLFVFYKVSNCFHFLQNVTTLRTNLIVVR